MKRMVQESEEDSKEDLDTTTFTDFFTCKGKPCIDFPVVDISSGEKNQFHSYLPVGQPVIIEFYDYR
jgi:hypothetical protein